MIAAPTTSEPVKVTMSTAGSVVSRCPTSGPPVTTLSTPGGKSAASAAAASTSAENGVNGDGLSTTVFPAARAGPTFHRLRKNGKLNGVTAATTPTGGGGREQVPHPPPPPPPGGVPGRRAAGPVRAPSFY